MKKFALSDKDKETLLSWGYPEKELQQIEDAANIGKYLTSNDKSVSWLTAKRMVGTQNFLSGISRAAFHWTAMRYNSKDVVSVYFNFSNYFK